MCLARLSRGIALLGLVVGALAQANITNVGAPPNNTKVLILGGGMAGVIAARTLHEQGIDDFIVVDAKTELGGRMIPKAFGLTGRQSVVEMGPNWIQGTQEGNGTANPIWVLAQKHNLSTAYNDLYGSICSSVSISSACVILMLPQRSLIIMDPITTRIHLTPP